jgi:hypothetical protein
MPRWLSWGYFDSLGKIVAGLTAIVVLITGIVTLVLLLLPNPLPARKATLSGLQFVAQESLADFLQETGKPTDGHTPAELRQLGNYYIVRVSVEGLRNQQPEIVWSVHSRGQESHLQPELWIHQLLASFEPPAENYEFTAQAWIQRPPVRGRFYALIEVDYPQYAPLAISFSKDFWVRHPQPIVRPTTTTVTRTYVTVRTTPRRTTTTTSTTSTTPTTTPTTIPATTATVATTTTKTVTSPEPIVRPPAVTVTVAKR